MTSTDQTTARPVVPGREAPVFECDLLDGTRFRLADRRPENFTMVVFYRGNHCPVCRLQLRDLDRRFDNFAARGVEIVAVSADERHRAERSQREWPVGRVRLGFGITIAQARAWGLYISDAYGADMPSQFSEPGVFLVSRDGILQYAAVTSMPFGRPRADDLLPGIDYLLTHPDTTFGRA
ncbi:MAG: peroxiredoxin family protein [Candidatus Dormibacteria bacterium]